MIWSNIIEILKYVFYIFTVYILAQIIEFILDKYCKKLRLDKWVLFLLLIKTPYVSTKLTYYSKQRPNINDIRSKIIKLFHKLKINDAPRNNSYTFKLRNHPVDMKIKIIEPSENKLFTITLETLSEDKLSKLMKGSFSNTIRIFEQITQELREYNLKNIVSEVRINYLIESEKDLIYNYKNSVLTSKSIRVNSKTFTGITKLVKECLNEWKMVFI